jgi:hypothetical protein
MLILSAKTAMSATAFACVVHDGTRREEMLMKLWRCSASKMSIRRVPDHVDFSMYPAVGMGSSFPLDPQCVLKELAPHMFCNQINK